MILNLYPPNLSGELIDARMNLMSEQPSRQDCIVVLAALEHMERQYGILFTEKHTLAESQHALAESQRQADDLLARQEENMAALAELLTAFEKYGTAVEAMTGMWEQVKQLESDNDELAAELSAARCESNRLGKQRIELLTLLRTIDKWLQAGRIDNTTPGTERTILLDRLRLVLDQDDELPFVVDAKDRARWAAKARWG